MTYNEVKECFDAKRDYIIRSAARVSLFSETLPDPPSPPKIYGEINLKNGMRQGTCLIYGPEEIIGTISVSYFLGKAVLQEQNSGKELAHFWGYNSHDVFKAMLVYPEGGRFYFTLTKGTDDFDAVSRFVDVH